MSAELLADANGAAVYHATWRDLLPVVEAAGGCDALIVDAPYSERTHKGHDGGAAQANRMLNYASRERKLKRPSERKAGPASPAWNVAFAKARGDEGGTHRAPITYGAWTTDDVSAFVAAWSPMTRGWVVSVTDHVLAPAWADALEDAGRYVFAPLPFVAVGSRVRLTGDGPSVWSCWIVVARPKSRAFVEQCCTLPGAYVLPGGEGGAMPVVGGKPLWLAEQLAKDYSRPGDLIVDPCCGAGTMAAGAIRMGRRAIVGDMNREHAEMAARWVRDPGPKCPTESEGRQKVLF